MREEETEVEETEGEEMEEEDRVIYMFRSALTGGPSSRAPEEE